VRAVGERAKAEAETREQRTRRRAQLAALTALGLLLVGGGALLLWRAEDKAERARVDGARMTEDARRAEQETARLTRNTDALAAHVNRCEDALRKDDAVTAAAALTEIDRRLREGGGEALADRVARCRADLALLRGLDSVDQFRWTPVENHLPRGDALAEKWRATFAAAGLDVKAVPPAELAGRVANSLLRDQLVAQLDMWLVESPSNEVREVLRRLDADSYRDAVRDAILMKDAKRIAELSGRAEALAQRPGFTAALGWQGAVPFTRRREILEVALGAHPGNLTLLLTAGTLSFPNVVATEVQWLRAAVAVAPKNPIAYLLVGLALLESGDLKGAEIALRSAHGLNPVYPHIRTALGALFLSKGYKHLDKHEFDLAITEFREAVRVDPTNYRPHIALALTHHEKGDLDAAITEYKATIQCAPKFALAHSCLGLALRMNGDLDGAVVAYNKAIEIDPKYAPARDGLAWLFATGPDRVRDGKQAVEHATRACELTAWKQPGYIDTLGAAHAETGDFDKASEYQKKALSFPNHEKNVGGLARQRLTLYARQKAYRDPGLQPRELAPPPHGVKR
jgi:eukaryotic-like serine/threonine-protein kinase